MSAHDGFWDGRKPAAVLKHGVLANYLTPFCAMTSSTSVGNRVWFIDAYAGPGEYKPGPGESSGAPGSPLIAMNAANRLAKMNRPRHLRCVFIEQEPEHIRSLQALVASENFGNRHVVFKGSAEANLRAAVERVGKDPLLTFLDPFGTALPFDLMKSTLLARPPAAKNEILLNFHLPSVARIGALLRRPTGLGPADQHTLERLDLFLGSQHWRKTFLERYSPGNAGTATEGALAVAEQFRRRVFEQSGYRSFVIDIRKAIGHLPIFQLTLFFRHNAAEYKFADAASLANAAWRKSLSELSARDNAIEYADALLPAEFSQTQFEDQWRSDESALAKSFSNAIVENIIGLFRNRAQIKVRDNVAELYGSVLGLAGEKHLRAAWKQLAAQGITNPHSTRLIDGTIERHFGH
jgi:three-Cys-motif partner protein